MIPSWHFYPEPVRYTDATGWPARPETELRVHWVGGTHRPPDIKIGDIWEHWEEDPPLPLKDRMQNWIRRNV